MVHTISTRIFHFFFIVVIKNVRIVNTRFEDIPSNNNYQQNYIDVCGPDRSQSYRNYIIEQCDCRLFEYMRLVL